MIGVEATEFIYDKEYERFEPEIQKHTFKLFQLAMPKKITGKSLSLKEGNLDGAPLCKLFTNGIIY